MSKHNDRGRGGGGEGEGRGGKGGQGGDIEQELRKDLK